MMVKKLVQQEKGCEEEDHEVENLVQQEKESEEEDHDGMKKLTTREGTGLQRKKIIIVKKFTTREGRNQIWMVLKKLTGKEEQISDMAKPTNQVKNVTTTHPHTSPTGPAYIKLLPYKGTMPVNNVMVENAIAMHLKSVCTSIPTAAPHHHQQQQQQIPNTKSVGHKTICYNKFRNTQALKKKKKK
jgi:hypothetical protein